MLQEIPGTGLATVGGDQGFDTADFVRQCRHLRVTPHRAQNLGRRGGRVMDGRTARHTGYRLSPKKSQHIEECFGGLKSLRRCARCALAALCGSMGSLPWPAPLVTWHPCGNWMTATVPTP